MKKILSIFFLFLLLSLAKSSFGMNYFKSFSAIEKKKTSQLSFGFIPYLVSISSGEVGSAITDKIKIIDLENGNVIKTVTVWGSYGNLTLSHNLKFLASSQKFVGNEGKIIIEDMSNAYAEQKDSLVTKLVKLAKSLGTSGVSNILKLENMREINIGGREVTALSFGSDDHYLAAGLDNGKIRIYITKSGNWKDAVLFREISADDNSSVCCIALVTSKRSKKRVILASCAYNGESNIIKLWDINNTKKNNPIKTFTINNFRVTSISLSSSSEQIVLGFYNGDIKVLHAKTGKIIEDFKNQEGKIHKRKINSVFLSPDEKYIVSGSSQKIIKLWHRKAKTCKILTTDNNRDCWHDQFLLKLFPCNLKLKEALDEKKERIKFLQENYFLVS